MTDVAVVSNMTIQENVNINATVTIPADGIQKPVMYLNASMTADSFGINTNTNVVDKDLYLKHSLEMKKQYSAFQELVKERATALGYIIF